MLRKEEEAETNAQHRIDNRWNYPGDTEIDKDWVPIDRLLQKDCDDQQGQKYMAAYDLNSKVYWFVDVLYCYEHSYQQNQA